MTTKVYQHPIESLLTNDAYKFSMGQCILHNFPKDYARFDWHCRSDEKLGWLKPEIDKELDYICSLRFKKDELDYLRAIPWLADDYIDYLECFYLKRDQVHTEVDNEGQLVMWAEGPWRDVSYFEIPCLAIVSELYMKHKKVKLGIEDGSIEKTGLENVKNMIHKLADCWHTGNKFTFADFGLRRRFGSDYHHAVIRLFKDYAPEFFVGTSDVSLAKEFGIKPIGTFAHEMFMVAQGMNVRLSETQKFILDTWAKEYRGELGIALSDIYGFRAFLRDFDKYFAKLFDGCRHDSGDPIKWGEMLIEHYKKLGIDPLTKIGCWSDSLNADKCVEIAKHFAGKIKVSFGVGTAITNSTPIKPLNMVMKVTEANGNPVAKLSDSLGKGMCKDEKYVEYLKSVFNYRSIDED